MRPTIALAAIAAIAALAAIAVVVPIAIVEIVPSGDGPQHLLAAWAVVHPELVSAWVTPRVATGGTVFTTLLIPLLHVLEWRAAYAVGHALLVVTWLLACCAVGSALGGPRTGIVVGAATAYSWAFYIGLSSFHLGVSFALFAVAIVVAARDRRPLGAALLAMVLAIAAHAHPMAGAMGGFVVVAAALARDVSDARTRWPRRVDIARILVCGVPAAALAVWASTGADVGGAAPTVYDGALDRLTVVAWGYLGGPSWRAWPPVVVALLAVVVALRTGGVRRGLAIASVALVVAAWLLPRDAGGWQHVNERPLLLALTIALLLVDVRVRALAIVACVLVVSSQVAWSASLHRRFAAESSDLRRHLDDTLPAAPGYRLPVIIAPADYSLGSELEFFNPFWNLGHLFPLGQGGFVAFSFSNRDAHHLERTPTAPRDPDRIALIGRLPLYDPADREMAFADLLDVARTLDGVIAYQEPTDHDRWLARGYVPVVRDERLLLATFRGCRARIDVAPGVGFLESGFSPRTPAGVTRRHPVPAGAAHVDIDGLGCGRAWLTQRASDGAVVPCAGRDVIELDLVASDRFEDTAVLSCTAAP